jgi:hypothetical protein
MAHSEDTKRIQVSFTIKQWKIIEQLKGELGITDSEVVRNIVIGWLMEKSFLSTLLQLKLFGEEKIVK